ncbi:MAG: hypothetical protein ACR2PA_23565 [Hyphomicrobiaceae bacterium]
MTVSHWSPLASSPEDAIVAARLQSHVAAQWLARMARAFLAAQPDYSHTNLGWDDAKRGFFTHALGPGNLRAGLMLDDLALVIGEDDSLALDGRTDSEVGSWVAEALLRHGLPAGDLDNDMPDELSSHALAGGGLYNLESLKKAQSQLADWFANADRALNEVHDRYRHLEPGPSPVRCWPHHFDLATLISLEAGDPERARSVGVGLSPGDDTYAAPYFYVNPWPQPQANDLPDIGPIGGWHTEGFVGVVATAGDVVSASPQPDTVYEFLDTAVTACLAVLDFKEP